MAAIDLEPVPEPNSAEPRSFRENFRATHRNFQAIKNQFQVFNVLDYGAKLDGSDSYNAIMGAFNAAKAAGGGTVVLPCGTLKYGTTITLDATYNGISLRGQGRFASILWYTGSGDGFSGGGNINGFTASDFRLYTTTGRDGFAFNSGSASSTPDAGVLCMEHLDIRGFLRHGIKARLLVDFRTDHLEVVQNGGCGLFIENVSPYLGTTYLDTGSWFHANGGHGIVLKRIYSHKLDGTIVDSNTGVSTDPDVIGCGGYTLSNTGAWVDCVDSDLGKTVTQGGVSIGTLAHYDNPSQYMIVNATIAPPGTGALAISSGTGSASSSSVSKNNIGVYAKQAYGLSIDGIHNENHKYGHFIDTCDGIKIRGGKIITQGSGAWGFYLAGVSRAVDMGAFHVDVQSGGAGDIYWGDLGKGFLDRLGHRASGYTFTNRSPDSHVLTSVDDGPLTEVFNSSSQFPYTLNGAHASGLLAYLNALATSGTPISGFRLQTNVSPGYIRDLYLGADGNFYFLNPAQGKRIGILSAGGDRVDQRIFWGNNAGLKVIEIGPTQGQMTGSNVEADFTIDIYDDSGTLIDTSFKISRANRYAAILAGKSTSKVSLPGTLFTQMTEVGNSGSGETDLFNISLGANIFVRTGDTVKVRMSGKMASNANNKKIQLYLGATKLYNSGSGIALNGGQWTLLAEISRSGANAQKGIAEWVSNSPDNKSDTQETTPGETETGAITLKGTGTGVSNNDILCEIVRVEYWPAEPT